MYLLLKMVIFHCYVSLPEGTLMIQCPFKNVVPRSKTKLLEMDVLFNVESSFFSWCTSIPNHIPIFQPPPTSMPPSLSNNSDPQQCGDWKPKGRSRWSSWWIPAMSRLFQTKVAHNNEGLVTPKIKWTINGNIKGWPTSYVYLFRMLYTNMFACSLRAHMKKSWNPFNVNSWLQGLFSQPHAADGDTRSCVSKLGTLKSLWVDTKNQSLSSGCIAPVQSVHIP